MRTEELIVLLIVGLVLTVVFVGIFQMYSRKRAFDAYRRRVGRTARNQEFIDEVSTTPSKRGRASESFDSDSGDSGGSSFGGSSD